MFDTAEILDEDFYEADRIISDEDNDDGESSSDMDFDISTSVTKMEPGMNFTILSEGTNVVLQSQICGILQSAKGPYSIDCLIIRSLL